MATKYLSASANASVAVWWTTSGGSTTTTAPTTGDDADLNGNTLTVDQAFACDNIVGAGTLAVSGSRTITANLGNSSSAWTGTFSSGTHTINGNIVSGTNTTTRLTVSGFAVVTVNGNVTAGTATSSVGLRANGGSVTLSIIGSSVAGASGGNASGVLCSSGTLNITVATITGGTGSPGLSIGGGTANVTASLVDRTFSAVSKTGGTFNYTPTSSQTATIGGKVLYPTRGAGSTGWNAFGM